MNPKQMKRNDMAQLAAGEVPEYTAREKKRRLAAVVKHWAYLGKTFIPHPDFYVGHPAAPKGLKAFWLNGTYSVQIYDAPGGMTHLMVRRHDEGKDFPWYDLQGIKNEFCGTERVGVEVFPPVSKLVDDANLRHLWVYPEGHTLGFGL